MVATLLKNGSRKKWLALNYSLVASSIFGPVFLATWTLPFWRALPDAFVGWLFLAYLFVGPVCVFLCPALMLASGPVAREEKSKTLFYAANALGFLSGLSAFWTWKNLGGLFGSSC